VNSAPEGHTVNSPGFRKRLKITEVMGIVARCLPAPYTLTLSQGERGPFPAPNRLPLPLGEGRGEGSLKPLNPIMLRFPVRPEF